jgi:ubiquinone/menaquinone biosynthesis C-methylase UbiE
MTMLREQFGKPSGWFGSLAGAIMAHRPSNRERAYWTLSLLDVQPTDRVLEIGFGPGVAIERAGELARQGFVAGVDHSEVMFRQAAKRNREAIGNGRVELCLGEVEALPSFGAPFDKIFAINSTGFWPDPVERLRELETLLVSGGLIALTVQPRGFGVDDESARRIGQRLAGRLTEAGYAEVRTELHAMKPVATVCALGVSP